MINHSIIYLLSRITSAFLNLGSVAVFSRMLSPSSYGAFAMVLSISSIVYFSLFHWLNETLFRFWNIEEYETDQIVATILKIAISITLFLAITFLVFLAHWPTYSSFDLILYIILIVVSQFWYRFNLEISRVRLAPLRYAVMWVLRSVVYLILGIFCVYFDERLGLIIATIVAAMIATLPNAYFLVKLWNRRAFGNLLRGKSTMTFSVWQYGSPLIVYWTLDQVVLSGDKLMIAYFLGDADLGMFSAVYDLTWQSVLMVMVAISTALNPIVIKIFEAKDMDATQNQLRINRDALILVGGMVALTFCFFNHEIANIVVGPLYREKAVGLMPIIAIASGIFALKLNFVDLPFILLRKTRILFYIAMIVAGTNLVLNLLLIPALGLYGALISKMISLGLGTGFSLFWGGGLLPLPKMDQETLKVIVALLIGSLVFIIIPQIYLHQIVSFAVDLLCFFFIVVLSLWLFDVHYLRSRSRGMWNK